METEPTHAGEHATVTNGRIVAPWSARQVLNADAWQRSGHFHPYTCGNRDNHPDEPFYGDHGVLRATVRGWVCAFCDYTQKWAHDFTLNHPPPPNPLLQAGDAARQEPS